jgi:hypothetical protein
MLYIKVKSIYDNIIYSNNGDFLIGNELYTIKEFEKIRKKFNDHFIKKYNVNDIFEYKTVSKHKTYFFFGARFEIT